MVQKAFAAFVMSLGVALVPVSNQAFGGSTRALLPVAAWDHMADSTSSPFGDLGAGPFGVLYVDAYRPSFTCTYDIPWDWAHRCPPIPNPPEPPLAPAARALSCVPQSVTVPGAGGKDQTITMVRC